MLRSHLDFENHLPACHFSESRIDKISALRIMSRGFLLNSALGAVSQKNVAVLLDFVQMRGEGAGGGPCSNFLSHFHICSFGQ